jgi:hypothetical protein
MAKTHGIRLGYNTKGRREKHALPWAHGLRPFGPALNEDFCNQTLVSCGNRRITRAQLAARWTDPKPVFEPQKLFWEARRRVYY